MPSRAKSFTRCANASSRSRRSTVRAATTAPSTPPRYSSCSRGCTGSTPPTATLDAIWPNVQAALNWIDEYGDTDRDGFVEYRRRRDSGLVNQGWKDSGDAVFHEDGRLAEAPIALCEVQAYVYLARTLAARMAEARGDTALANRLTEQARSLRETFEAQFWDEELGMYVLALDGEKRPCRVRTSNAGQVLFTGIASPERAARMAQTLPSSDFLTGWGIRTVSAREQRFNPTSYHNGSIWPHDNALIALGLARYGHADCGAPDSPRPFSTRPRTWTCGGCPSCSAACAGSATRGRFSIPWPARRRHGPQRRLSGCCRPAWDWKWMPPSAGAPALSATARIAVSWKFVACRSAMRAWICCCAGRRATSR